MNFDSPGCPLRGGRKLVKRAALAAAALACVQSALAADMSVTAPSYVKGRLIVMGRAGLGSADLDAIVKVHGGKSRRIGKSNLHVVDLPASASDDAVKAVLARNPHLRFVERDAVVTPAMTTNDPYLGSEWHLSRIGTAAAWDRSVGAGVTIAIIDSGVDASHPDLSGRVLPGWNFYANSADTSDQFGHGTAVAGTAAASMNNGVGVAGVAGGARILPVRISDASGNTTWSALAQGIVYAADSGARVANISYQQLPGSSTIQSAAQYMKDKGGLVVVCAGNTGTDPGYAFTSTMIPVSATTSADAIASWSSYGRYVAVAAPGDLIWTTNKGGGYGQWWGTSFASPVTAGTVALMMAARPDLPNTTIEALLFSSATDLGTAGRDDRYGYGRIDASAALTAVVSAVAPVVDSTAPSVAVTTPVGGSAVAGLVAVDVGASDNVGVTRVDLRVNGKVLASDSAQPFQFTWDSKLVANGSATIDAVAYDAAGNSKTSAGVVVNVANTVVVDTTPPVVTVVNPVGGAKVSGTVQVSVSASDNKGVAGLSQTLYVDGKLVASASGGSLSYSWNVRKAASGAHTLQAVAKDAAGNTTTATVSVTK